MSSQLSLSNSNESTNDTNENFDSQSFSKRRGKGAVYDFYSVTSFEDFLKNFDAKINCKGFIQVFKCDQNVYRYKFKRQLKEDIKFYYQCSPLNQCCPVSSYITIKNNRVSIFIEDESHDHCAKNERGISDEVKMAIKKLYDLGVKSPKAILNSLKKQGLTCPLKHQLQNYLVCLRKAKTCPVDDSLDEYEDSNQSKSEYHFFQRDFYVDFSLYIASYQWISTIKAENIIQMMHEDKMYYYSSMDLEKPLNKDNVIEFVNLNGQFSKIASTYLDKTKWQNSTCNCEYFLKKFVCHHIIGLAYKYKLVDIPENARYLHVNEESCEIKDMFFEDENTMGSL